MTPVGMNNASTLNSAQANMAKNQQQSTEAQQTPAALKVESNKVTLSDEGKALLAALSQIDKEAETTEGEKPTKVESFAHGALGLDHPETPEEEKDSSYSAGQYLKGALSVGAILLAVI